MKIPEFLHLGTQPYENTYEQMRSLVKAESFQDQVWLLEHPSVFTLGTAADPSNILNPGDIPVIQTDRGGEVTCHMPGQLVIYLVLDLKNFNKDLNWYLRKIEKTIIKVLGSFNINSNTKKGLTGVWIGNKKIASIGIGCKRWVTINGFSINVDCELSNFNKIVPCGIKDCLMANMSDYTENITIEKVKRIVKKVIKEEFNFNFVPK